MNSAPASYCARIPSPSRKLTAALLVASTMLVGSVGIATAQDTGRPDTQQTAALPAGDLPTGLWLTTPFPEFSAQTGERVDVDLALTNRGMPPQRAEFEISGLPEGWTWEILGDNRSVDAAIAPTGETVELELGLTPPADAEIGDYEFEVAAVADGERLVLPITLTLAETEPARLTLEPELPALRGTPDSTFDFQVKATNEGQEDVVVNLLSQAPAGFEVTFKEGYGSQELTSVPIDSGQSKDLKISVEPPQGIAAGQYPVTIAASGDEASVEQRLVLDITGQPEIALAGPGGRVSGDAVAGEKKSFTFTLENTGTAPAQQVEFSSSPPQGWEVSFEPETIDEIVPGGTGEVAVSITPSANAIAGDYVVPVRTNAEGASDSANFRVTVETSTLWGVAGLGVIAAAVVVLGFSVSRYGRR